VRHIFQITKLQGLIQDTKETSTAPQKYSAMNLVWKIDSKKIDSKKIDSKKINF
jgi:hypothetical protein